jgi:hypothetical protein
MAMVFKIYDSTKTHKKISFLVTFARGFQIKLLCLHHHVGLFIFTCHAYTKKHHIIFFSTQMHFLFLHTNLELTCFKFNYYKHKNYQNNKNAKGH